MAFRILVPTSTVLKPVIANVSLTPQFGFCFFPRQAEKRGSHSRIGLARVKRASDSNRRPFLQLDHRRPRFPIPKNTTSSVIFCKKRDALFTKNLLSDYAKPQVEVLGGVYGTQKISAFSNSDVFLFPSTCAWESFGLVLVEAAHFGLPCITYQPMIGANGLSPTYHRRVPMGEVKTFIHAVEAFHSIERQNPCGCPLQIQPGAFWRANAPGLS